MFHTTYFFNEDKNKVYSIPLKTHEYHYRFDMVGIDLGATECCAAVIRKNGPDFIVLDPTNGFRNMPSFVAFDEAHDKCGKIVVDRMRHKEKYTVFDSKRILGRTFDEIVIDQLWPFEVGDHDGKVLIKVKTNNGTMLKTPEEISGVLLKYIKTTAEIYQGQNLSEAVITIPSGFSDKQINATAKAAKLAGWEKVHFIKEPVAAAFAYFSEFTIPINSYTVIFDFGGGTVDICVAKREKDQIVILSFDGDPNLGGRDFDKILFDHFKRILKEKHNFDVTISNKKYVLRQSCQDIKHNLSTSKEAWLDVSDFNSEIDEKIDITRTEFEALTSHFMLQFKQIILQATTKSKLQPNEINFVFQVGGGCRMPMVKNLLADIFPTATHQTLIDPAWAVAHGATLYGYHLKNMEQIVKNLIREKNEKYIPPPKLFEFDSSVNAVGIDFGTTECCAAVIRKNGPNFVVLDDVTYFRTLPSYVAFDEEEPKCGKIVVDRMRHKSEFTVYDIKQIIGKNYEEISKDPLWPFRIVKKSDEDRLRFPSWRRMSNADD